MLTDKLKQIAATLAVTAEPPAPYSRRNIICVLAATTRETPDAPDPKILAAQLSPAAPPEDIALVLLDNHRETDGRPLPFLLVPTGG